MNADSYADSRRKGSVVEALRAGASSWAQGQEKCSGEVVVRPYVVVMSNAAADTAHSNSQAVSEAAEKLILLAELVELVLVLSVV